MAAEPPHVADLSRRRFIAGAARFGLTAAAAAAMTSQMAFPAFAAPPELPAPGAIPEKLKGSGTVRVCSYGGALQAAQRQAYFKPFEELSGIRVLESEGPDIAKVKAMVDTNNVEYDVGEFDRASVINLGRKGAYWEPIDYSLFDTDNIDAAFRAKDSIAMLPYGQVIGYRTDVFGSKAPTDNADLWDTKTFPGTRALQAGSGGLSPDLEVAIMASGVPKEKVYPIDLDRAFASLAKIKPSVDKWWTAGAQPAQLLNDKEVTMGDGLERPPLRDPAERRAGEDPVEEPAAAHRCVGDPERGAEHAERAKARRFHHPGDIAGAVVDADPVWLRQRQGGGAAAAGAAGAIADRAGHQEGHADLRHRVVGR